jgi:hypothetical protein
MIFDHSISGGALGARLLRLYGIVAAAYVVIVVVLWALGLEAIYGSPTPFYALYYPAFASPWTPLLLLIAGVLACLASHRLASGDTNILTLFLACWIAAAGAATLFTFTNARAHGISPDTLNALRWPLASVVIFAGFGGVALYVFRRFDWFDTEPSPRFVIWFLFGLIAFAFMFSGAVAMTRDGLHGISQAYERHGYEYISDIGVTRSIQALFHDYLKIHDYLSMHAKVHPPGPIAMLWSVSMFIGQDPLPLSIVTMLGGSLAIVPLYFWAADMTNRRVAITCAILYSLMPSIVLFTATSADILFTPFTMTTMFLFWRALHRRSIAYAAAAGCGFALMSLLSFSLLAFGAYFAYIGLWRLREPQWRRAVIQTAVVMALSFLAIHALIHWWSDFDMIACFNTAKGQFDADQSNLDNITPRYSPLFWKFANPVCWFFFAGVPVSILFLARLWPQRAIIENALEDSRVRAIPALCAMTFITLSAAYLARGEGERSAIYVFPFVALPAALLLEQMGRATRSFAPAAATTAFLAAQCWAMESVLYTFW